MSRKVELGITILAFLLISVCSSPAQERAPSPRLITVVGTSEINVAPDEVSLRFGIESTNKVLIAAKEDTDSRVKKVIALARIAGVDPKDIETEAVRLAPDYSEEKVPKLLGYEASQELEITLKDISKYETLMTKLLEAGVNRVRNISFHVGQTRKIRDEARAKALRAAKEKATAMAAELGQTIGKPWEIVEMGEGGNSGPTSNFVSYNYARVEADASTVAPGQVTIRAQVQVSFVLE